MNLGKTIQIYMPDGSPTSIIYKWGQSGQGTSGCGVDSD